MSKQRTMATYHRRVCSIADGKFLWTVVDERVRVMAVAEGYAMVRHKGAMPFAVSLKDISEISE